MPAAPAPTPLLPVVDTASTVRLRVSAKEQVADGVVALTLADPEGKRLPDWAPGAHIDVTLPNGLTRQFSLCGDRWDAHTYRVAVLREPGGRGGSAWVHDRLAEGDLVTIGGPRNNFGLVPARRYLFIAGGIGITPLLPMVRQAELLGADWQLLYGGRTRSSMAFLEELAAYGEKVTVRPHDEFGRLDLAAALAGVGETADAATKVYCCGPASLLAAVETLWGPRPVGALRTERFVPKVQGPPVRDAPFALDLARSGRTVTVTPGISVLEALRQAGVTVLSSCQRGVCGTCETPVLAGQPDHRDSLLNDDERATGDTMFVCVSRSCSDRLLLDL